MLSFAGFVALAIVVIVTPGPDTALTIRNTLVGGRPAGIATALGVAFGQATWSLATSVGVAAVLVAAESAFAALKLAGAPYMAVFFPSLLPQFVGADAPPFAARSKLSRASYWLPSASAWRSPRDKR